MYYNTKASGARIRELRLAKKLDQIELAELLNVSHGYISRIESAGEKIETGLKKMGAMLADHVEVGCNSVLNPGTVIGRNSNIYPTSCVRGCIPANSIYKNEKEIVEKATSF